MQQALEIETVVGLSTLQAFPQLQPFLGHRIRMIALDLESPAALVPAADPAADPLPASEERPTGDAVLDHYQPRTELGRKLLELRRSYIEGGGKLMTQDEIRAEVRKRRGGVSDD